MRWGVSEGGQIQVNRSEAQRRYQNLIQYRVRPMLNSRTRNENEKILLMKRLVREANNIRAESLCPAGPGTREELVDLLSPMLGLGAASEELQDWIKRCFRAFGAYWEGADFE